MSLVDAAHEIAPACSQLAHVSAAAPAAAAPTRSGWKVKLPPPSRRNRSDEILAAARMREARSAALSRSEKEVGTTELTAAVDAFREAGVIVKGDLQVKQNKKRGGASHELLLANVTQDGKRRKQCRVTPGGMLRMSYEDQTLSRRGAAGIYGLSPQWLGTLQTVVADGFMASQRAFLLALKTLFASRRPSIFVIGLSADETRQKVDLKFQEDQDQAPAARRSAWSILVSSSNVAFSFDDDGGNSKLIELVRPPVPLIATNAEGIADGLWYVKQVEEFLTLERAGAEFGGVSIRHFDFDNCSANDRLFGYNWDKSKFALQSKKSCGNHDNNLVEQSVIAAVNADVIKFLFTFACFIGMSGHFLRLVQATEPYVRQRMVPPVRGQPPDDPREHQFVDEFVDYFLNNHNSYRSSLNGENDARGFDTDDEEDAGMDWNAHVDYSERKQAPRHRARLKALQDYMDFFKGSIMGGRLGPHYCKDEHCCSGYDREVTNKRAAAIIVALFFATMMQKPEKAKWTKLGPAVDWMLGVSLLAGNILRQLFPFAFGKLLVTVQQHAAGEDQAFTSSYRWHAVAGSRAGACRRHLQDQLTTEYLLIEAICIEGIRFLTSWFLMRSSLSRRYVARHKGSPPPICWLTRGTLSPIVRVLEHLSALMAGTSSRLKLIWARRYDSFSAWAAAEPRLLSALRRGCASASAWVYQRHWLSVMRPPFVWAGIVDTRRTLAERQGLADRLRNAAESDLDAPFSAKLRKCVEKSGMDLMHKFWQNVLVLWCWIIMTSIAPDERKHGRNKHRGHDHDSWTTFVSKYVRNESRIHLLRDVSCLRALRMIADGPPPARKAAKRPKRAKRATAIQIFRKDYIVQQLRLGRRVRPISVKFWTEVKMQWCAISTELRECYVAKARASKSAADARRQRFLALEDASRHGDTQPADQLQVAVRDSGTLATPNRPSVMPVAPHENAPAMLSNLAALPPTEVKDLIAIRDLFGTTARAPIFPLHVGKLQAHLSRRDPETGTICAASMTKIEQTFRSTHCCIGKERQSWGAVNYAPMGGGEHVPENIGFLHAVLRSQILKLLSDLCDGNLALLTSKGGLLIHCRISYDDEFGDPEHEDVFSHAIAGNSQAGLTPARIIFAMVETYGGAVGGDSPFRGLKLVYSRKAQVARKPLVKRVTIGRVDHKDLEDFAAFVCNAHGRATTLVTITRLVYNEVEGDKFLVTGSCGPSVLVDWDTPLAGVPERPAAARASDARDAMGDGSVDWFSDVHPSHKYESKMMGEGVTCTSEHALRAKR